MDLVRGGFWIVGLLAAMGALVVPPPGGAQGLDLLGGSVILLGDVNGDGAVDDMDADALVPYLDGTVVAPDEVLVRGDVDLNGVVDAEDRELLVRFASATNLGGDELQAGLLAILMTHEDDDRATVERFIERCGAADDVAREEYISFLVSWLERRGGMRSPERGQPGFRRRLPTRSAALLIVAGLSELDLLLLGRAIEETRFPPEEAAERVAAMRAVILRIRTLVERTAATFEGSVLRGVLERLTTIIAGLDDLAKTLPTLSAESSPSSSSSSPLSSSPPVPPTPTLVVAVVSPRPTPPPPTVVVTVPPSPSAVVAVTPPPSVAATVPSTPSMAVTTEPTDWEALGRSVLGSALAALEVVGVTLLGACASAVSHPVTVPLAAVGASLWLLTSGRRRIRRWLRRRRKAGRTPLEPLLAGEMAMQREDYDRAIHEFQALIDNLDEDQAAPARLRLTIALASLGQTQAARWHFERLDLSTAGLDPLHRLGCEFQRLQQTEQALKIFRAIVVRDGTFRDVTRRIRQLQGLPTVEPDDATAVADCLGGRYRDFRPVRRGERSSVYRVRDTTLGRDVALKGLSATTTDGFYALDRFDDEVEALSRVEHSGVVRVLDWGLGDLAWLTMEFVEGEPLDLLLEQKALGRDWGRIVSLALLQARALRHAHERGVLHRDFKPENVILLPDDTLVIVGWVVARAFGRDCRASAPVMLATPAYMAPEVVTGLVPDPQADIYAFGLTLYETVAGLLQSEGRSSTDFPFGSPRPVSECAPACPPPLAALIERAVEPVATRRYRGFDEVVAELERIRRML